MLSRNVTWTFKVKVGNPGPGNRATYNRRTKEIVLSSPNDAEGLVHELLHAAAHMMGFAGVEAGEEAIADLGTKLLASVISGDKAASTKAAAVLLAPYLYIGYALAKGTVTRDAATAAAVLLSAAATDAAVPHEMQLEYGTMAAVAQQAGQVTIAQVNRAVVAPGAFRDLLRR